MTSPQACLKRGAHSCPAAGCPGRIRAPRTPHSAGRNDMSPRRAHKEGRGLDMEKHLQRSTRRPRAGVVPSRLQPRRGALSYPPDAVGADRQLVSRPAAGVQCRRCEPMVTPAHSRFLRESRDSRLHAGGAVVRDRRKQQQHPEAVAVESSYASHVITITRSDVTFTF